MIYDDQPQMVEAMDHTRPGDLRPVSYAYLQIEDAFASIDREALIEKVNQEVRMTLGAPTKEGVERVLVTAGIIPEKDA